MKRLDLVRKLEQSGCVLLRHGGRHGIYHNPKTGRSEPVPRHREINEILARRMTITATKARSKLYKLIDDVAASHEAIEIKGKRANAFLISEDDWRSIQETLYLLSIPGMRESIRKGLRTPAKKCSKKLRCLM